MLLLIIRARHGAVVVLLAGREASGVSFIYFCTAIELLIYKNACAPLCPYTSFSNNVGLALDSSLFIYCSSLSTTFYCSECHLADDALQPSRLPFSGQISLCIGLGNGGQCTTGQTVALLWDQRWCKSGCNLTLCHFFDVGTCAQHDAGAWLDLLR
jgi:hypothetical protein